MKAKPGYSARALLMFRDEAVGAERADNWAVQGQ